MAAKPDPLDPQADCFKPPPQSVLVECIHCGEEYESYLIEWRIVDTPNGQQGFWCCPTEGCGGAGFGFDIFPVDPEAAAQFGIQTWEFDEDEELISNDTFDDWADADSDDPEQPQGSSSEDLPSEDDIPY